MGNPWIFAGLNREQVTPTQVRSMMNVHLERNIAFYGPTRGIVLFRKFVVKYLTPYRLPRALREKLLTCSNVVDFNQFLDSVFSLLPLSS